MAGYLIDVNLPRYFYLWSGDDCQHICEINDEWKDSQIWQYAEEHDLTIVTKDADFSELSLINKPPPRVIHIKFGNMKMREFHKAISRVWVDVTSLSRKHRLVRVYRDRIEAID